MHQLILDTLAKQDIPYYYLKRPQGIYPCVVFHYNEFPCARGDNREELTLYDCYFNVICQGEVTTTVQKIKKVLEGALFQKVVINEPVMFDGDNFYQITMNYKKIK